MMNPTIQRGCVGNAGILPPYGAVSTAAVVLRARTGSILAGETPALRRQQMNRRGTATVEFALTIPLLGLVLSLTFFFGWELTNKEHVRMSDRWAVWRTVRSAGEPIPQQLSDAFFKNKAANVNMSTGSGPDTTLQNYVQDAGKISQGAQQWAQNLVIDRFPRGLSAHVSAEFPSPSAAWARYTGAIHSAHSRDGVEWRRDQARCEEVLAQEWLTDLDGTLTTIPTPGDSLADTFRNLYLGGW